MMLSDRYLLHKTLLFLLSVINKGNYKGYWVLLYQLCKVYIGNLCAK